MRNVKEVKKIRKVVYLLIFMIILSITYLDANVVVALPAPTSEITEIEFTSGEVEFETGIVTISTTSMMPQKTYTFRQNIIDIYNIDETASNFEKKYREYVIDYKSRLMLYLDPQYAIGLSSIRNTRNLYLFGG